MKKEVRLFNDNFDIKLTDTANLLFLDHIEEDVEVKANTTEINGTDGALMGPTTFGPFNLVLNFSFKGLDTKDLKLYKQKIRSILYQREPYYVWHSDAPGKKYAVYCDSNDNEDLTNSFATFAVTFVVFKGYSESLKDTDEFSLSSGDWQLEQNILARDDIKYEHDIRYFQIYNGSSDTINPLMHHKLKIDIEINAPKGFSIVNLTNGNEFQYFKPLKNNNKLTILGVHPYLNNKRVGKNTNYDFLTLEPGFNEILIKGKGISNSPKTKFTFPFIYR